MGVKPTTPNVDPLAPQGEPTGYLCFTFRCTLCEHSHEWRDGFPKSADEVRITMVDGETVKHRTMYEKDHCFICRDCMGKRVGNKIAVIDAHGTATIATLIMYPK